MAEPTFEDVMTALRNADAAGDTASAAKLAGIAQRMRSEKASAVRQEVTGGEGGFFAERPSRAEYDVGDIAKAGVTGAIPGAVGGALTGYAVSPLTPQAAIGGAVAGGVGGFLAGAGGEVAKQSGASPATQLATEAVLGLGGSPAATVLSRSGGATLRTLGGLLEADPAKAYAGIKSLVKETPQEIERRALTQRAEEFGKPIPGFVEGKITGQFGEQTQQQLAKQFNVTPAEGKTVSSTLRNKMNQDVANVVEENFKNRQSVSAMRGLGVTPSESTLFSDSSYFKSFKNNLLNMKEQGKISSEDVKDLTARLNTDKSGSSSVRKEYGDTVDTIIREWQGAMGKEGKAALAPAIQNKVRDNLRKSFNEWQNDPKINIGEAEKAYRSAYRAEKVAETKDSVPALMKLRDTPRADEIATQLGKTVIEDPETKTLLRTEISKQFANMEPKEIASAWNSLDKVLYKTKLMTPEELASITEKVNKVSKVAAGESIETAAKRAKRVIMRSLGPTVGGIAGSAVTPSTSEY